MNSWALIPRGNSMHSILENREAQPNVKMFYFLHPSLTHTWEILVDSRQLISAGTCRYCLVKWSVWGVPAKAMLLNAVNAGCHRTNIFYVICYFRATKPVSAPTLTIAQFLKAGATVPNSNRKHKLTASWSILFRFLFLKAKTQIFGDFIIQNPDFDLFQKMWRSVSTELTFQHDGNLGVLRSSKVL